MDFRTKIMVNALALDEIVRLSGLGIDEVAASIQDENGQEKPIHEAIKNLAEAISDHADVLKGQTRAASFDRVSVLRKRHNDKTNQTEWALMDSEGKRVLEWYGKQKPSEERIKKSEKRIQWFSKGPGKKT